LALLRVGQLFHSLPETSGFAIIVRRVRSFSVLEPTISDYPSLDHTYCMEGGVSSALAVARAPARTCQYKGKISILRLLRLVVC